MNISRRRLLGAGIEKYELRPPWLKSPSSFTDDCTRCGACLEKCPQHIILIGDSGYPCIDFSNGECTFCGECTAHCEPALFFDFSQSGLPPWDYKATISESCLASHGVMCRCCEDACEPAAIRFLPVLGAVPKPALQDAACTGCGACISPCPEQAISVLPGA